MAQIPLTLDELVSEANDVYQAADMMAHIPDRCSGFYGRYGKRSVEWLMKLAEAANELIVCSAFAESVNASRDDVERLIVAAYYFGQMMAGSPESRWLLDRYRESRNGAVQGGASVRLSDDEKRSRAKRWERALTELQRKNPNITKGAALRRVALKFDVSVSTIERALRNR